MCPATIFLWVTGLFTAAVFVAVFWSMARNNSQMKALLEGCGGSLTGYNNGSINVDGCQVAVVYTPAHKNTPSSLRISLKGGFFAHAVFRRETDADRFSKSIGLSREIQLNDPAFDDIIYVECEDEPFVSRVTGSPEAKEHLKKILVEFGTFSVDGHVCVMVKTPCGDLKDMGPESIMPFARSMAALAGNIPLSEPGQVSATPLTDECRWVENFILGFAVIVFVASGVLTMFGFNAYEPLFPGRIFFASLSLSVPLGAAFLFYIYNEFKGLSNAGSYFSLTALLGAAGIVLVCWGGLVFFNGSQDVSGEVAHHVAVMNKYATRNKSNTTYQVVVSSWEPGFSSYSFSAPFDVYGKITLGGPCVIRTREGLFKFEWVAAHECPDVAARRGG